MSRRISKRQEAYFNALADEDRRRSGGLIGALGDGFSCIFWRFIRGILGIVGILLGLMALSWLAPLVIAWMIGVAMLWPVYVLVAFAARARFRGDRIGFVLYVSRLRTVLVESWDWVSKGAIAAAAIGLITAVSNVVAAGIGVWRALDLAGGTALTLIVASVCVLEIVTRRWAIAMPTREVAHDSEPEPAQSRQVPAQQDEGPRANRQRPPAPAPIPAPATARQIDAPGPRSAASRKAAR